MTESRYILFSDLDGTLLEAGTYAFTGAASALDVLRARSIPLILMTSKTAEETLGYVLALKTEESFSVENGGSIYLAARRAPAPPPGSTADGVYYRLDPGVPISRLEAFLSDFNSRSGSVFRALTDLTVEQTAEVTGLSPDEAGLALRRAFDLPLLVPPGSERALDLLRAEAAAAGLTVVDGGLFPHLKGPSDKGTAFDLLLPYYRDSGEARTVVLGDSANDLSMLAKADVAVLLPKPDGSWNGCLRERLPRALLAPRPGPAGWAEAVLDVIEHRR